ncbi:lovastatin nonaketide synthase [Apiospora phragmitis]|uniref:Lovastatin nonaketide synthase n=1 Tax=Apiospora phragmitis TaxID=2905665 RepID=A0ABR1VEI3_9PEZI
MVLRDVSILNMSYEQFTAATRPKVLGSVHLDHIFGCEQAQLDFFILLSSMNCVVGTRGQANYAAANIFMCALAAGRRTRGLAACALNVGTIMGVGYMEREASKALDLTMREAALIPLSETDFHRIFAAGVEAGRPGAADGPVVSTGLSEITANAEVHPRWCEDPKFLHFVSHRMVGSGVEKPKQTSSVSIADKLGECRTEGQLLDVIQGMKTQARRQSI